jgi:hypothetical protein
VSSGGVAGAVSIGEDSAGEGEVTGRAVMSSEVLIVERLNSSLILVGL